MKLEEISDLMRENLRKFLLFDETHEIGVRKINEKKLWVGYRTTKSIQQGTTTHFDLNIIGNTCYILWIELVKEYRGRTSENHYLIL